MKEILIFGHKKPDTDAVTSAITLSHLKNRLGFNTKPCILGDINNETKFVLDYFGIKEPKYLNDVKLQVKDLNFEKNVAMSITNSIYNGYTYMSENEISSLPIVDKNNKFIGAVSMKEIVKYLVDSNMMSLHTSFDNLIDVLNGEEVLKFDNDISGDIVFASIKSTTFIENIKLDNNTILILGDRHSIIEYAVASGVKLIIITGNGNIKEEHLELAKINHVNIIKTSYLTYKTSKLIPLTNYIDAVLNKNIITVSDKEYVNEFAVIANKTKRSNYPVINRKGECLGILRLSNIHDKNKKQVILVDHNEKEQSVDGLEEAEIVEIVDHHKIGANTTSIPINFRNMTVGSTNTIIYKMYKENNVEIPKDMASLMLAGIISDTLLFKSPTTTYDDKIAVFNLAEIAHINYVEFAKKMFEAGSSLVGKTMEEIIFGDFKNFNVDNKKIGISQLSTTNATEIINNLDDYVNTIEKISKTNDYDILAFFVTDIIKEGSYILYSLNSKEILELSFEINNLSQGQYLPEIISRKKQIIPKIVDILEKK